MKIKKQTYNATIRPKLRRMLQLALVAGLFASATPVARAQTDLQLPAFPSECQSGQLPVADEIKFPFPANATTKLKESPSAAAKAVELLGLSKHGAQLYFSGQVPAPGFTPPASSLTHKSPLPANIPDLPAPLATLPRVPTISASSSSFDNKIVLASASALETSESPPRQTKDNENLELTAGLEDGTSLSNSLVDSESLIDIDITDPVSSLPPKSQASTDRQPEIVKQRPAMQLHSRPQEKLENSTTSVVLAEAARIPSADEDYHLSDEELQPEIPPSTSKSKLNLRHSPLSTLKTMSLHIEGETKPSLPETMPASASVTIQQSFSEKLPPLASARELPSRELPSRELPGRELPGRELPGRELPGRELPSRELPVSQSPKPTTDSKDAILAIENSDLEHSVGKQIQLGIKDFVVIESIMSIESISIEHPQLCQVLKGRDHGMTVVGLRTGKTRVAVFSTDELGKRNVVVHEVTIGDTLARHSDSKTLATEISQAIRRMYPQSRIEVLPEAGGLTVQGSAVSENEAKKIVGLVRKTSLQPVSDRIAINK